MFSKSKRSVIESMYLQARRDRVPSVRSPRLRFVVAICHPSPNCEVAVMLARIISATCCSMGLAEVAVSVTCPAVLR